MQIRSLGQENTPEQEMETHASVLAWEIHGQESLMGYSAWGCKRVRHNLATKQPPRILHSNPGRGSRLLFSDLLRRNWPHLYYRCHTAS